MKQSQPIPSTIQHAIVGCGRIAPSHAEAFQSTAGACVVAACDPCPEALKELSEKYAITKTFQDFRELLEDQEIHSVSICTPHHQHVPMTLQALARGKHVLLEKPLAIHPSELRQIQLAAQDSDRILQPVCQHRFDATVQAVKRIVDEDLGDLCMLRAHLECRRPPEYYRDSPWRGKWETEGGSVLINQAYHVLDLLLYLAGPLKAVSARYDTLANSEVMETEDSLVACLQFDNRSLGSLTVNGSSGHRWHSYIELSGTRGWVGFDIGYPNQVPRLHLESRRALQKWRKCFKEILSEAPIPRPGADYYGDSHRHEAASFVRRIRGETDPIASTWEEAIRTTQAVQAIYRASQDKAWTTLEEGAFVRA